VKGWPPRFCAACGTRVATLRPPKGHDATGVRGGRSEQRRCPACGWIFYANPVPAAVALITRGRSILLARRANAPYRGTWDLPGGFLEAGETPDDGLRRELSEELGLGTRRSALIGFAIDRYGAGGFPVLALIYRVTPAPGAVRAADDVSEARWFPRDRLPLREVGFPAMRAFLRRWSGSGGGQQQRSPP
jgi:ADP-ribose pyrophosphatase YjhB (NUDIX family)